MARHSAFPPTADIRVFGNQHAHLMSHRVLQLEYVNANVPHSPNYRHTFKRGVQMWGLSDGGLLIRSPGHRIWNLYDLEDGEQ